MTTTKRLFIAVDPAPEINAAIGEWIGRLCVAAHAEGLRISWANPGSLHVTLKFLGTTPIDDIPRIEEKLREAGLSSESFPLIISGAGAFPNERSARVLWGWVQDPSGMLRELAFRVEREMASLGFRVEERAYSPHLTLGRVREGQGRGKFSRLLDPLRSIEFGKCSITEMLLYESRPRPTGGSEYVVLSRHALRQLTPRSEALFP